MCTLFSFFSDFLSLGSDLLSDFSLFSIVCFSYLYYFLSSPLSFLCFLLHFLLDSFRIFFSWLWHLCCALTSALHSTHFLFFVWKLGFLACSVLGFPIHCTCLFHSVFCCFVALFNALFGLHTICCLLFFFYSLFCLLIFALYMWSTDHGSLFNFYLLSHAIYFSPFSLNNFLLCFFYYYYKTLFTLWMLCFLVIAIPVFVLFPPFSAFFSLFFYLLSMLRFLRYDVWE